MNTKQISKRPHQRWSVIVAGVVILMCLGVAYSWGVFLVPIDEEYEWGRAKISFAVSVLLLVFSIFMAVGGMCEKKFGARKTASMGGVLVGLGWILSAFAHSPLELYCYYGVLAGIGTGLSYMPALSTGIKWFPNKKGLVSGIILFGFGVGTACFSPVITYLITQYGWRTTMQICGAVFLGIIMLAAQLLIPPDTSNYQLTTHSKKPEVSYTPKEMIQTSAFKVMFVTYFFAMIAGMMTIGHIVAFSQDRHFSAMQGALALTILSFMNGVGRVSFGYISDVWGGKRTLILLFFVIGCTMFLLYHANTLPVLYGCAFVIGLCFGGFLSVYPPLAADYFGDRDFAINYGLIFIGYGSGCFLGPLIGGIVHDYTSTYFWAFYAAGSIALLGGIIVFGWLKMPSENTEDKVNSASASLRVS